MNNKTVKFAVAAALIGSAVLFSGVEAKAAEVRITLPGISLCFGSDDHDHCPPPPPPVHHEPVVVVKPCPSPPPVHHEPVVVVKPCSPPPRPVVVVDHKPAIDVRLDFKDRKDHKRFDRPNPKPQRKHQAAHRPKSKASDHKSQPGHRR